MLGVVVNASPVPGNLSECTTQVCQEAAKSIREYVDFNADPCSDFYQFACGTWEKGAVIPEDKSELGALRSASDENMETIRTILEGTYDDLLRVNKADDFVMQEARAADKAIFDKAQSYYRSCMNVEAIDAKGPSPVYPRLAKVLHAASPSSSWADLGTAFRAEQHAAGLTKMLVQAAKQASQPLIAFGVGIDSRDPSRDVILITQPDLILQSRQMYENEEAIKAYGSGMTKMLTSVLGNDTWSKQAREAGIDVLNEKQISDMVERVVKFEIKLASVSLPDEDLQDPFRTYNPMTLSEVQEKYPIIDWKVFLENMVPTDTVPDPLVAMAPAYLSNLTTWLSSGEVSLQAITDYLTLHELFTWSYALDTNTRQLFQSFVSGITTGSTKLQPRWLMCVSNTKGSFGDIVGRYYVMAKFGGEDARARTDKLVNLIHEAWLNRLTGVDWLDKVTRERAIKKVNKIKRKVAYSTVLPDDRSASSLEEYYSDVQVHDEFIDSETSIVEFQIKKAWDNLIEPTDKDKWTMYPSEVNAYYNGNLNQIAVPAGILRSPFYGNDAPDYLNYGGVGMVIGHELTHAFDNMGRMYDGDGRLRQWWTNETAQRFEEKAQCFIRQYSNFTVSGPGGKQVNVNGKLTLGENLADNGGTEVAYTAFKQVWDQGPLANGTKVDHVKLPGIDLTPEQLFFVNMGRLWCYKPRPEMALSRVFSDPHAPSSVRVNGVMQNSKAFAEAFNCPADSRMNPADKCSVW